MNASGSTAFVGIHPEFTSLWSKYATRIRSHISILWETIHTPDKILGMIQHLHLLVFFFFSWQCHNSILTSARSTALKTFLHVPSRILPPNLEANPTSLVDREERAGSRMEMWPRMSQCHQPLPLLPKRTVTSPQLLAG